MHLTSRFQKIRFPKCQVVVDIDRNIYIYIYIMRQVQVTPGVTLQNYTFSKLLNLSRSNSQKNVLINGDILIKILFIILIYNILYLSLNPKICIFFSMLSLFHPLHVFYRKPLMQSSPLPLLPPSPPMWSMCYGVQPFYHPLNFTNLLPIYLFICSSLALDFQFQVHSSYYR